MLCHNHMCKRLRGQTEAEIGEGKQLKRENGIVHSCYHLLPDQLTPLSLSQVISNGDLEKPK